MGILDKKVCVYCKKECKSVNTRGLCSECENQINEGKLILCSNEGCNKKAYIDSIIDMCKTCHFKENICIKCGKVSDLPIDENGICHKCNEEPKEIKEPKKTPPIKPPKKQDTKSNKGIILGVLAIVALGIGYFAFSKTHNTPKENMVVHNSDTIPDKFSFQPKYNVNLNNEIESNSVKITGINKPASVHIINGEYSINSKSWSKSDSDINNNDEIKVRHISSSQYGTKVSTLLSVGGVESSFVSETKDKSIKKSSTCSSIDFAAGLCK